MTCIYFKITIVILKPIQNSYGFFISAKINIFNNCRKADLKRRKERTIRKEKKDKKGKKAKKKAGKIGKEKP